MRKWVFRALLLLTLILLLSGLALFLLLTPEPASALARFVPCYLIVSALAFLLTWLLSRWVMLRIADHLGQFDLSTATQSSVDPELAPMLEQLQETRAQSQQQLEKLHAEHSAQDQMRRDFTANVSHELKTPLTSVAGYAELIGSGMAKPEDIPHFAGKISDAAQHMIRLVNDIIKLSQLDGRDVGLQSTQIDLYALCEQIISELEYAAQEQNVTLQLTGDRLQIQAPFEIVDELVFNLCDNAVKYNRPGGSVQLQIRQCVDGVELTVSDTGIGISEADLPHIFERFYRADKSHSRAVGGTGLGLSIVKHGAMYLGASVFAESKLGEGTTIRVLF